MEFKELTKSAKAMAKSDKLFLGRIDDSYYICNGYWLAKVHKAYYETVFRPVSPRFIPLEDQEGANTMDKKRIPEKCERLKFEDIIGKNECFDDNKVHATQFISEIARGKTRIIENGDTFMQVNEDFWEMMKPLASEWYGTSGSAITPIYSDFTKETAALILPIRMVEDAEYQVVNRNKAVA